MTKPRHTMEIFCELDASGTGFPFDEFFRAVSVWAWMQPGPATVRAAADAFHATDDIVRRAVDEHPWLFIGGPDDDPTTQTIEHEGL